MVGDVRIGTGGWGRRRPGGTGGDRSGSDRGVGMPSTWSTSWQQVVGGAGGPVSGLTVLAVVLLAVVIAVMVLRTGGTED